MLKFKLLFLSGVAILFTACSSDNVNEPTPPPLSDNDGKVYEVSLSLGGEFVEVSESPLSRASEAPAPKNYYGVNVYCMKTDGSVNKYSHYAYGVFDDLASMKLMLLEGYKYKFECTTLKERENYRLLNDTKQNLSSPFTYGQDGYSDSNFPLYNLNKFSTSAIYYLNQIEGGYTSYYEWLGEEDNYATYSDAGSYPPFDRYYGELENYEPAENGVATINMTRTSFGVTLHVNEVPDGSLKWNCYDLFHGKGRVSSTSEPIEIFNHYTFAEIKSCWNNPETYSKDFTIDFKWTRENGYEQWFSKKITVKRNINTILTVSLDGGSNNITFGLHEEDTEMGVENDSVSFNGGALTDTDVDPVE